MIRPLLFLLLSSPLLAQPRFEVEEATIAASPRRHARPDSLTCRALVAQYLKRIDAYDKNGPAINSIVIVNPDAEKQADELDRRFAQSGLTGPLHCVPDDRQGQLRNQRPADHRRRARFRRLPPR